MEQENAPSEKVIVKVKEIAPMEVELMENQKMVYVEYRYNIIIFIIYSFLLTFNIMLFETTPPITVTSPFHLFNFKSDTLITMCSLSFVVANIILNIPANFAIGKNIRISIIFASIITLIGAWARVLINSSFGFMVIGSMLSAIAQPILYNSTSKISSIWWNEKHRTFVTSLLSLITTTIGGSGFVIPTIFVKDEEDWTDTADGRKQVTRLLIFEAILGTIMCVPTIILFKRKPLTPPSYSAQNTCQLTFMEQLKTALRNKSFVLLMIMYTFVETNLHSTAIIVELLIKPFGFSKNNAGIGGALTILAGIVSTIFWGYYAQKTSKFKRSLLILCVLQLLGVVFFVFAFLQESTVLLYCGFIQIGQSTMPMIPLGYELASELIYPIGEEIATGFLVFGANCLTIIQIFIFDAFFDGHKTRIYFWIALLGIFNIIGFMSLLFVQEKFERRNRKNSIPQQTSIKDK